MRLRLLLVLLPLLLLVPLVMPGKGFSISLPMATPVAGVASTSEPAVSTIEPIQQRTAIQSTDDHVQPLERDSVQPLVEEFTEPQVAGIWQLEEDLLQLTADFGGVWGIYFATLEPLPSVKFELQADRAFYAASTTKVPLVLWLYEQAALGDVNLDEQMVYLPEDDWDGAGLLRYEGPGGSYALRHLAELAIRESDNVATVMLERRLGLDELEAYMVSRGGRVVDMEQNITSPRDMGQYLLALLQFNETHPSLGAELLDFLATTSYRHRIPVGLPSDVLVANKTGTWPHTNSDIAIVFQPGNSYILIVFVEDIPEATANVAIAAVAERIHETAMLQTALANDQCESLVISLTTSCRLSVH